MEQWKQIEHTNYSISDFGRVRNDKNNKILKPMLTHRGYYKVELAGKGNFIHRLVAKAFISNNEHKPQVNHIDGNKLNNNVNNLEWCTNSENAIHAINNGLWDAQLNYARTQPTKPIIGTEIETGVIREFTSVSSAERFIDSKHVSDVLKNKRTQCKGWTFIYKGGDAHATH